MGPNKTISYLKRGVFRMSFLQRMLIACSVYTMIAYLNTDQNTLVYLNTDQNNTISYLNKGDFRMSFLQRMLIRGSLSTCQIDFFK